MIDASIIRRAFARAAPGFAANDFLHAEIRQRLLDRLAVIAIEPRWIIDLGSAHHAAREPLQKIFPAAEVLGIDLTEGMLRSSSGNAATVCADAAMLPIRDDSIDLIFCNLLLHHCPDPTSVLTDARRVLSDNGVVVLTTFGPSTLIELGRAFATADAHTHISPFIDLQSLGGLLTKSGFTEPVLDTQMLTITYPNLEKLIRELRQSGSTNATSERNRGLTGRQTWARLTAAYDQLRDESGRLPLTVEVQFAIAWAGRPARARSLSGEPVEVSLEQLMSARRNRTD